MFRLIYMSRSNEKMSEAKLKDIMETAQSNNAKVGVTGMLLYAGDTFFQVLEGRQTDVEAVFDRVFQDPRHSRVRIMGQREAENRAFPDWSMGFKQVAEDDEDSPAFFDLSRQSVEERIPESAADDLMLLMRGYAEARLAPA